MSSLVPGQPLDKAGRKRLAKLLQAVSGDMSERGAQLASERILVLAPQGEVTVELATFVARVLALALSHCPRCLDPSIGLCNPCRPLHAAEAAAAHKGVAAPRLAAVEPQRDRTADASQTDPERACFSKHRYETPAQAEHYRQKCEAKRGVALRWYACSACHGFHLTRRPA